MNRHERYLVQNRPTPVGVEVGTLVRRVYGRMAHPITHFDGEVWVTDIGICLTSDLAYACGCGTLWEVVSE